MKKSKKAIKMFAAASKNEEHQKFLAAFSKACEAVGKSPDTQPSRRQYRKWLAGYGMAYRAK